MSQLNFYIALLGGKHAQANVEVHDVVPAIAANIQDAFPFLQQQWFGLQKGLHLDSWMHVDGVQYHGVNYQIHIQDQFELSAAHASEKQLKLFLINLGAYLPDQFGEVHKYVVVAAYDKADAKIQGKLAIEQHWFKPHTDAVIDIDDCLALDKVGSYSLHLVEGDFAETQFKNDYIVL